MHCTLYLEYSFNLECAYWFYFYIVYAVITYQSHIDDEYAAAGFTDPKICITTSRAPSSKLKQFAKVCCISLAFDS